MAAFSSLDTLIAGMGKLSGPGRTEIPDDRASYRCTNCQDRGVIVTNDRAYPCSCMAQRNMARFFKHSQLADSLQKYTLEGFGLNYYSSTMIDGTLGLSYREMARRAWQASGQFLSGYLTNSHITGLLFTGPVGSGKTHLAAGICNGLLQQGVEVLFAVVPDFLDELRATFDRNSPEEGNSELQLMDKSRKVGVLILDDLGVHNYTPWTRNRIYSIINYRVNHSLPTIVTTNLEMEEMENLLGERTTSRLLQLCRVYRMQVAEDIRYQLAREQTSR